MWYGKIYSSRKQQGETVSSDVLCMLGNCWYHWAIPPPKGPLPAWQLLPPCPFPLCLPFITSGKVDSCKSAGSLSPQTQFAGQEERAW